MGGRGASSAGSKAYGFRNRRYHYGDEYRTVHEFENVKYVVARDPKATNTAPVETQSEDRIYAFVNAKGALTSITFFDDNGMRSKQIDLKEHGDLGHHVHDGYNHDGVARNMTAAERRVYDKVVREWERRRL